MKNCRKGTIEQTNCRNTNHKNVGDAFRRCRVRFNSRQLDVSVHCHLSIQSYNVLHCSLSKLSQVYIKKILSGSMSIPTFGVHSGQKVVSPSRPSVGRQRMQQRASERRSASGDKGQKGQVQLGSGPKPARSPVRSLIRSLSLSPVGPKVLHYGGVRVGDDDQAAVEEGKERR